MTGGYGNSYASTVGNQAYQGYLQQLNDKVPELYQMALNKWQMGKDDLYNQYGMLLKEYEREYGLYSDEYNKLLDQLGLARNDYYDGADMHYTEQNNYNDILNSQFNNEMSIWDANQSQSNWEKNHNLSERELQMAEEAWAYEKAALGDINLVPGGDNSGTTPTGVNYNNGSLSTDQIKELQKAIGVDADGYYGPNSKKAAGGLSADEAWDRYRKGLLGDTSGGVTPTESKNTTQFISRFMTKSEYLARGKSEKEFSDYMEGNIASFLRSDRITESEALYLIQYYGLK
jgi:hypothetical protein